MKQDVTISDNTGSTRLTLWQTDIDKLEVGTSYKLKNLILKSFDGSRYLCPKSDWSFETCGDVNAIKDIEDDKKEIVGASITGLSITVRVSCLSCKSTLEKIDEATAGKLGKCTKCYIIQKIDKCPSLTTAKLLITTEICNLTLLASLPII